MSENRLGRETSPYLLQHKDNPVHWWAWGPEALAEAKRTGKPILLSVGYAACHWCHVMAHESFENEEIAGLMNALFVNVKVDREERPDVDAIYMAALHRLGQQGGWPLTMFLDGDARPFWGGTYFPPESRWGRAGFPDVLREVSRIFKEDPARVAHNANALVDALQAPRSVSEGFTISAEVISDLTSRMVRAVDPEHGGINGAPKFPQWSFFWLLWRGAIQFGHEHAKQAVVTTLTNICQGGIYDHLAGGFARYSTDERWLAPHFEKMLYDNALLVDLMVEVWKETQEPLFKLRVEETVSWLLSEMVAEGGGFAASLDADSEGEEGKFYVWAAEDVRAVLGSPDFEFFSQIYDVTREGNWEGHTILNRLQSGPLRSVDEEARLAGLRGKLLAARTGRIRPGWDDKVLADWNGLMIAALSRAAVVFQRPDWLAAAQKAFEFISSRMCEDGRLKHAYRIGMAKAPATANDYANMIWAALRLHEATLDDGYIAHAERWSQVLDLFYWAEADGGYTLSARDTADLIVRLRGAQDEATPNANAIQLANLTALHQLTGKSGYDDRARAILESFEADLEKNALGHCTLLASAVDVLLPQLVVISGNRTADLTALIHRLSLPGALIYDLGEKKPGTLAPGLAGKEAQPGETAAYVCSGQVCSPPINSAIELRAGLIAMRRAQHRPAG